MREARPDEGTQSLDSNGAGLARPPAPRFVSSYVRGVWSVWLRNALVWRKLAIPSLTGNVLDPLMGLLAFGFGVGGMLPAINGQPYLNYLVCGTLAMSAMHAATFEALYSAFSRMHVQRTWEAIMNTPVSLTEIVLGEWVWAASKSVMSSTAMLVVVACLGIGSPVVWLQVFFCLVVGALMFSALALCVNAKAPGYDFFMFYFTLCVTPMTFLSGAFFPRSQLPGPLQTIADGLPLSLLVDMVRAAFDGHLSSSMPQMLGVGIYLVLGIGFALRMTTRRFAKS